MRLDTTARHIAIAGRPTRFVSHGDLIERLQALGVRASSNLNRDTDALVLCAHEWALDIERQARQRGVPILTEEQAAAFLEAGFVELEGDLEPDTPLDALIGEARALLDGAPTSQIWDALVALLDQCAPEHESALTDYLTAALERGYVSPDARYTRADPADYEEARWLEAAPAGHLRVAPRHWIAQALQGRDTPKLRTADALVLHTLDLSNPNVEALLATEGFSHVRHLDPRPISHHPTGRVLKVLASSPMASNLTSLVLPSFKPKHARALSQDSPLSLRRLILTPSHDSFDAKACQELTASGWLEHLEELVVHTPRFLTRDSFVQLHDLENLTISIDEWFIDFTPYFANGPRAHTLSLAGHVHLMNSSTVNALLHSDITLAHTLDLSLLAPSPDGTKTFNGQPIDIYTAFIQKLPKSSFGRSFQAVRLGHWHTKRRARPFDAQGIAVLDTREVG